MPSRKPQSFADRRTHARYPLDVTVRLLPVGYPAGAIDGRTIDVSESGVGVRLAATGHADVDRVLEELVEDRVEVEVTLRLAEGSVSARGQLVWWGILGSDTFAIRGGVLLSGGWAPADWKLIEKTCTSA